MKKVIIELDDFHDSILSITAIGTGKFHDGKPNITIVATAAFDLEKGTNIRIGIDGQFCQSKDGD